MAEQKPYSIPKLWGQSKEDAINTVSDEHLEKWAADPNCNDRDLCAQEIARRSQIDRERQEQTRIAAEDEVHKLIERRQKLADYPFDPRNEVSADARHIASRIVANLWIIFVLLPFVLGVIYFIVK